MDGDQNLCLCPIISSIFYLQVQWLYFGRVPVFEHRIDNIVGIAYAMDMLDYVEQASAV